jgi:antitoxin VapB
MPSHPRVVECLAVQIRVDGLRVLPEADPLDLQRPAVGTGGALRMRFRSVSIWAYTHGTADVDAIPSRVFMNGNSQAVRIPAEFRLSTDRVQISRTADGDLLIHPCPTQRGQALLQTLAGFDADFVAALEEQQARKLPVQDRELL